VPGHEVAAVVDKIGAGVRPWQPGDRVGVGWHGGHCFVCDSCRVGDFVTCREEKITGIAYDGGYATHMVARAEALARIPDELGDAEAAPPPLRRHHDVQRRCGTRASSGDLVAVQGIGGLGHLAVQFAHHMGFRTVRDRARRGQGAARAKARRRRLRRRGEGLGRRRAREARRREGDRGDGAERRGVADVMPGLGIGGQLLLVAAVAEPLPLNTVPMLLQRHSLARGRAATRRTRGHAPLRRPRPASAR
jgi:alcohol dehydrogenase/propanol-preferring alcohol dehydrogenase